MTISQEPLQVKVMMLSKLIVKMYYIIERHFDEDDEFVMNTSELMAIDMQLTDAIHFIENHRGLKEKK